MQGPAFKSLKKKKSHIKPTFLSASLSFTSTKCSLGFQIPQGDQDLNFFGFNARSQEELTACEIGLNDQTNTVAKLLVPLIIKIKEMIF